MTCAWEGIVRWSIPSRWPCTFATCHRDRGQPRGEGSLDRIYGFHRYLDPTDDKWKAVTWQRETANWTRIIKKIKRNALINLTRKKLVMYMYSCISYCLKNFNIEVNRKKISHLLNFIFDYKITRHNVIFAKKY